MDDLVRRAQRAARWVADQQCGDGSFPPLEAGVTPYYKAAACLTTAGDTHAAGRLGDWVRGEVLTPGGDFESSHHPRDRGMALFWPYPNAWLVYGFARLGALDLSSRGARYLASLQDPETGGFTREPGSDIDLFPTANAGLALLVAGMAGEASRAAALVRRAIDEQPDIERGIYTVWRPGSGGGALATEFKESHGWRYLVTHEPKRQMTFIPGMCATFLVRYAMATGSRPSMDAAWAWIEAVCRNQPHIYEWPETGKVGWAAALHHGATGYPATKVVAERVRDFLFDTQAEDGSWPRDGLAATLDVTAEFSVLLAEMASGLA